MLFPVMADTKLREGSMLSRFFVCEQSTQIICTRHTPMLYTISLVDMSYLLVTAHEHTLFPCSPAGHQHPASVILPVVTSFHSSWNQGTPHSVQVYKG